MRALKHGQVHVPPEHLLLPVEGNEELGPHQGVDDLQLLLAGVAGVGAVVLRDRKILAEDGMVVVILNLQHGQLLREPEIITRGFIYFFSGVPPCETAGSANDVVG